MRTVAAVAIVVGMLALPAWAQHGGSHGGFSGQSGSMGHSAPMGRSGPVGRGGPMGHVAPMGHIPTMGHPAPVGPTGRLGPMSRGGFPGGAGPMRFGGPLRSAPSRPPYTGNPGYAHKGGRGSGWNQGNRDHDGGREHHRMPYYRGYGLGLSYGYLGWPGYPFLWSNPGFYGNGDTDYNDNAAPYAYDNGAYGNGPVAPDAAYGDSMQPYPGYAGTPAPYNYGTGPGYPPPENSELQGVRPSHTGPDGAGYPPTPQQAVTVIFKDGRPPVQIHNYMLTATTLTVLDQKYREIPLGQINLAATEETNRAEGIDFHVPSVPASTSSAQPRKKNLPRTSGNT